MAKKRRQRRSAAEKAEIVREYKESGLSQVEFAKLWDISPGSLGNWVRESVNSESSGSEVRALVPVQVAPATSRVRGGIEIRLPSSVTVRIEPGFDEDTLQRALRVLRSC